MPSYYSIRNERAKELGFSSYYEQRKYRKQTREEVGEYDFKFRNKRSDIEAMDRVAKVIRDVEQNGTSGLTKEELYDTVKDALLDTGIIDAELLDDNGYDIPWSIIRHFYPTNGARRMVA